MGMLGKDLLDIYRPRTHVRVEFGEAEYWVENDPQPIPYGTVLTKLLDVDAEEYKNCLSLLRETDPESEAYRVRLADATAALAKLPFFRNFLRVEDTTPFFYAKMCVVHTILLCILVVVVTPFYTSFV